MARAPILSLNNVSLTFGGDPVFNGLDLHIPQGARSLIVGRNGSGKSTLMKVIAGLLEVDTGRRVQAPGTAIGYLVQTPNFDGIETLGEFARRNVTENNHFRINLYADALRFDPDAVAVNASGGERRKAALAGLLASDNDLLLLDEPTNHLDIAAISWLEDHLIESGRSFIVISHDRAFSEKVASSLIWIDRGEVRQRDIGLQGFEAWRDKVFVEEDLSRHKLGRKIKSEARWAVEGISARRKRNMGRMRALADLRAEKAGQIKRQGAAALQFEEGEKSGKLVIEAKSIRKGFDGRDLFKRFDLRVFRRDRIAIVGPNGVGKTTLIKVLTGEVPPDEGSVRLGENLHIARFDQNRAGLNPDQSLWDAMVDDPEIGASGRSDHVMVRGVPRHVAGYLKDFLFSDVQLRSPLRALSGGEQARLLLARLMARESNFLVLDEPTNDLDVETLDLLQEVLDDYPGTVMIVSHDRDFVDRIASMTIALEGDGIATLYAGGWSDYQTQKFGAENANDARNPKAKHRSQTNDQPDRQIEKTSTGLSFTETHRLKELPEVMDRLGREIEKLSEFLSDQDLFQTSRVKFDKASEALVERQNSLAAAEEEWLELSLRAEAFE